MKLLAQKSVKQYKLKGFYWLINKVLLFLWIKLHKIITKNKQIKEENNNTNTDKQYQQWVRWNGPLRLEETVAVEPVLEAVISVVCVRVPCIHQIRCVDISKLFVAPNYKFIDYFSLDEKTQSGSDYVLLIAECYSLWPEAHGQLRSFMDNNQQFEAVYGDEDEYCDGVHKRCFFKPDWSPILFSQTPYVGGVVMVRQASLAKMLSLKSSDGGLTIDAAVCSMATIGHLATIVASSLTLPTHPRPLPCVSVARQCLDNTAGAASGSGQGDLDSVTIIIPTINKKLIVKLVNQILSNKTKEIYQIIIIINNKSLELNLATTALQKKYDKVTVVQCITRKFNYSYIINHAAKKVSTKYMLLLNDDIEIVNNYWLTSLVELASLSRAAVTGSYLMYPSGFLQHAGLAVGVGGIASYLFHGYSPTSKGYCNLLDYSREVSAVTFACALILTDAFKNLGGLNDSDLPVGFNDIDFCLRCWQAGYSVVVSPKSLLIHHESKSRGRVNSEVGVAYMQRKWNQVLYRDSYYNINLSRLHSDYTITY